MENGKNHMARQWKSVMARKGPYTKQQICSPQQETTSFLNTSFLLVYKVQFPKNLRVMRDYQKTNERILIYFAVQGTNVECVTVRTLIPMVI